MKRGYLEATYLFGLTQRLLTDIEKALCFDLCDQDICLRVPSQVEQLVELVAEYKSQEKIDQIVVVIQVGQSDLP